jgi:hypothetical protein
MVKEKWIWDNIMDIYLKGSNNYKHKNTIEIISHDNYFICSLFNNDEVFRFKISIKYSPFGDTTYLFEIQNKMQKILLPDETNIDFVWTLNIDFYVEKLKPIFREYKLKELL